MKRSLYIGKIKGIKINIHWTFLILIAWIFISEIRQGRGWEQGLLSIAFILTVFTCVVLHELGHAFAALAFGYKTESILLLPIGGVAQMRSLPEKPMQELIMAIAGPMVNVVIATIIGLYLALSMQTIEIREALQIDHVTASNFLVTLLAVNIMLVLFNIIPAFPMDGGRVLRALFSFRMNRIKATKIAAGFGQVFAVVFIIAGLMFNIWLVLIGLFIFVIARAESGFEEEKQVLSDFKVKDVLMKNFTLLHENDTLSKAVAVVLNGQEKDFIIMNTDRISGVITRDEIIRGLSETGKNSPITSVMSKRIYTLSPDMNLKEVFVKMTTENITICPVEENGELIGVLNQENIGEFLLAKKQAS